MAEHSITRSDDEEGITPDNSLCDAYELELQSSSGKPIRFGELVTGQGGHVTSIVVFVLRDQVRHFFCAYDQSYVHKVSQHLTNSILATLPNPTGPTQLIIIGCGDPALIGPFVELTEATFPIYTDPTGRLYETLHMRKTVRNITRPPSYTEISFFRALGKALKQMFQSGYRVAFKGGPWNLNGGELIFRGGKLVFVHRMKHVSDHLTADHLLRILSEDDSDRESHKEEGPSC